LHVHSVGRPAVTFPLVCQGTLPSSAHDDDFQEQNVTISTSMLSSGHTPVGNDLARQSSAR
jgi:hypothetical protein